MKAEIRMTKVWYDEDMLELKIEVSDGVSCFSNKVYLGYPDLDGMISDLDRFKDQMHGGLLDLKIGGFGPEWASGAFHARFHFPKPGKLFITCKMESEFKEFSTKVVASEATLYLRSEPSLLDHFVENLKSLKSETREDAILEAI